MDLGAQFFERFHIGVGAGKTEHVVPMGDQFPCDGGADESSRARNEYTHDNSPEFEWPPLSMRALSW
jgi:hypothetical protein